MPAPPVPAPTLSARASRIAAMKQHINASFAALYDEIRAFAAETVDAAIEASDDIEPAQIEQSVVGQVGFLCGVSPTEAQKLLHIARDLGAGLDHVRALFADGLIDEPKARAIVRGTSHLDPADRAAVDQALAAHPIETLGVRRTENLTRTIAAEVAPEEFAARAATARSERRVTIRPGRDGDAYLTARLPIEQAISCYAALDKAHKTASARPEPMTRTRGQHVADTFVERLTGQTRAEDVNIEVQILVKEEHLLDPTSPLPVELPGHGPVPAVLLSTKGRKTWRRLISREGIIIGGDSRSRTFTGTLAELITARDGGRCREAHCDAPIRHLDHIKRWSEGGRTGFDNGRGLCAFHNLVREFRGWRATRVGNTVLTTSPTGHTYTSTPERHTTVRNTPAKNAGVPLAYETYDPPVAMVIVGDWGRNAA